MKKNILLSFSLVATLLLSGCGDTSSTTAQHIVTDPTLPTSLPISLEEPTTCSPISITELTGATRTLNNSQDFSLSLLNTSKELLSLSESLIAAGSTANTEYVEAMLQLSKDIGTMADRILEMADKIVDMADKIGDMGDKIVQTQKIESENAKLTQENLLKAQKNFNSLLK